MEGAMSLSRLPGAAESHFRLEIDGLDEALELRGFESRDHALNRDYRFLIEAFCEQDPAGLHGAACRLCIRTGEGEVVHHGLLGGSEAVAHAADGRLWRLEMHSPLHPMTLRRRDRSFVDTDPLALCQQLVREACPQIAEIRVQVSRAPQTREFIVQYRESDLEFFDRLARWHGWFWTVFDEGGSAVLLIGDDTTALPVAARVSLVPQGGEVRAEATLQSLQRRVGLHSGAVSVRDYNYRSPEQWPISAEARSAHGGRGRVDATGEDARDADEAAWLATIRQQAIDAEAHVLQASGDVRHLRPGMVLDIGQAGDMEGEYLVTAISHRASQAAAVGLGGEADGPTYACELLLLPHQMPWRPAPPPPGRQQGLFQARVEARGEPVPLLDEQGRYRIRLGFDGADHPPAEASHPVRLATPYAGRDHGMHFPLHDGTEVVVGGIDGGLERPLILGALANPEQPLPVTDQNASENRLRTAAGNELLMVDTRGEERIELFNRDRANRLVLDAAEAGHRVELVSEQGELRLEAAQQMHIEVGGNSDIEVGGDSETRIQGAQRLSTREGDIETSAEGELRMTAGQALHLRSEEDGMQLSAGADLVAEAGGSASLQARDGDVSLLADNGRLSLSAGNTLSLLGEGGGQVQIGQAGAGLEIDSSGNVVIKGASIKLNAPSITVKGSSIGSN